jgi:hypothetical protein
MGRGMSAFPQAKPAPEAVIRYTADELATFMDYLRSAYQPAYAYYLDHALAAITRKRDVLTWMTTQPDFTTRCRHT